MAERTVEMDTPVVTDESADAVRTATERAERAEAELAKLRGHARSSDAGSGGTVLTDDLKQPPSPNTASSAPEAASPGAPHERGSADAGGVDELRKDPMMAHLLDSLDAGKDVGHYGRLTFCMIARHFLPHEEVVAYLMKDKDVDEEKASVMLHQVEGRDYSPPRRERLLEWQREQEFQFIDAHDPDSGNVYRNLKFPQEIYQHIGHYQEAKASE